MLRQVSSLLSLDEYRRVLRTLKAVCVQGRPVLGISVPSVHTLYRESGVSTEYKYSNEIQKFEVLCVLFNMRCTMRSCQQHAVVLVRPTVLASIVDKKPLFTTYLGLCQAGLLPLCVLAPSPLPLHSLSLRDHLLASFSAICFARLYFHTSVQLPAHT